MINRSMPSENISHSEKLSKNLFHEAQELFEYIERQKNVQLGLIGLIKGIHKCSYETSADPVLSSTLVALTAELKTSICSQKCIQADLSEVVKSISETFLSKDKEIPTMCSKEVSCESLDQGNETIPIVNDKKHFSFCEDIYSIPICRNSEEISCTEIALNDSFEECKFKCRKVSKIKNSYCSKTENNLNTIYRPNIYIYSLENICRRMCTEEEEWSEPFYVSYAGYRMRVKVGYSCKYMGIYVKMVRGDYDDSLMWPFKEEISFTLMNQINEEKYITRILKPQPCDVDERGYWIKPEFIDPCLGGWGLRDFIEKKDIMGSNGDFLSDFIRNDRIYIKIKLLD